MVRIATVVANHVQREQPACRRCPPKLLSQRSVKCPQHFWRNFGLPNAKWTAAEIHRSSDQDLVHRQRCAAVPSNACFITSSLRNCFAEADAHVLNSVVRIDLQIAFGLNVDVDQAVTSKKSQHVIEEAD